MKAPSLSNPILAREWNIRWRDWRSYAIVFCCVLALAFPVVSAFQQFNQNLDYFYPTGSSAAISTLSSDRGNLSGWGRAIFQTAMPLQGVLWLFLGALLTSGSIARERERGLLETLQLTPYTPFSQTLGRFLSALLFLAGVQLAVLPVFFISLSLGGVAPVEFVVASGLVILSAALGAAIGLHTSARSYRPLQAITNSLVFLGGLTLAAHWALNYYSWAGLPNWCYLLACGHPYGLLALLAGPGNLNLLHAPISIQQGFITFEFGDIIWGVIGVWTLLIAALLTDTARRTSRQMPPAQWARRNQLVEAWKSRIEERKKIVATRRINDRLGEKLVADLPLEWLANFSDPILAREVRGRFRLRHAGAVVNIARYVALGILISFWLFSWFIVFDKEGRQEVSQNYAIGIWAIGIAVVATLGALSFTRERESGTWESLRLSSLSAWEILRAKWLSPLLTYFYWSFPFLFIALLGLRWAPFGIWGEGVPIPRFILLFCVVGISLMQTSAIALWVSWRVEKAVASCLWTYGVIALQIWGAWYGANHLWPRYLYDYFRNFPPQQLYAMPDYLNRFFSPFTPLSAIDAIITPQRAYQGYSNFAYYPRPTISEYCGVSILLILLVLFLLQRDIHHEREKTPRSRGMKSKN